MPVKLCLEPRCGGIAVRKGRCIDHYRQLERERSRRRREKTRGVYKTRMWQMRRLQAIDRQPLCPGPGEGTPCPYDAIVEEVDHVVPLSRGGSPYDPENLVARCSRCHQVKTGRER